MYAFIPLAVLGFIHNLHNSFASTIWVVHIELSALEWDKFTYNNVH